VNKKIFIICLAIIIIIAASVSYLIVRNSKNEQKEPEKTFVYYCELDLTNESHAIWVDPEYNDYPMYYAAKKFHEEYNYTLHPKSISCEKVYQP
jgi:hypothetical protein